MAPASHTENVHILYVDANAQSADLFKGMLPAGGSIDADVLSSVKSACDQMEGPTFYDFIIVSLDAVSIERPNLLRQISYEACLHGTVVIFLTEAGAGLDRALAEAFRADTFMVKPAGHPELATFLRFLSSTMDGVSAGVAPIGQGNWNEPIALMAA